METSNNIFFALFVPGSGFGIPDVTGHPDVILDLTPQRSGCRPGAPDRMAPVGYGFR